jgi:hypothetical protein
MRRSKNEFQAKLNLDPHKYYEKNAHDAGLVCHCVLYKLQTKG